MTMHAPTTAPLWAPTGSPLARRVLCRPTHLSPLGWLALQAAALWPHGAWLVRRATDGSDTPLGLAALALLAVLVARLAPRLRVAPRTGWLAVAAALTLAANAALWAAPPLLASAVAALALAAGLVAWLPDDSPRLPWAGLALLALPLVASLQYYAGWPLRVVTAEASAWALQAAGLDAERLGTALQVAGRLVIVDAPCSGVQMAWFAYCSAFALAALGGVRDRALLTRLPFVGLVVLAGNVLRNAWLVALEARPQGLAPLWHEAIGLAVLAAVLGTVVLLVTRRSAR